MRDGSFLLHIDIGSARARLIIYNNLIGVPAESTSYHQSIILLAHVPWAERLFKTNMCRVLGVGCLRFAHHAWRTLDIVGNTPEKPFTPPSSFTRHGTIAFTTVREIRLPDGRVYWSSRAED
jgi:hypothetical protein